MKNLKYRALALDLDGTLTDSDKRIPKENKEAIQKAIELGVTVILASGRSTLGMTGVAKELGLMKQGGIIAAYNGGKIIDCKTNHTILEYELPHHLIGDLCRIAAKYGAIPVCYNDTQVVSENDSDPYVLLECKCNSTTVLKVDSLPDYLDYPVPKIMIAADHEQLLKVQAEIRENYGDQLVADFATPYFLDVSVIGVSKDQALAKLCEHLNITSQEMMVCGDGLNDVPMFDFAGLAVGMKNSYPEAAEHADVIVPFTNDEAGVAYAVRKYILGEELE